MKVVKPMRNFLVVKVDKETKEIQTRSGIILPNNLSSLSKPGNVTGTIMSVGPGKRSKKTKQIIPMAEELKEGVKVLFGYYIGNVFEHDREEYRVLSDDQVLGIVEE